MQSEDHQALVLYPHCVLRAACVTPAFSQQMTPYPFAAAPTQLQFTSLSTALLPVPAWFPERHSFLRLQRPTSGSLRLHSAFDTEIDKPGVPIDSTGWLLNPVTDFLDLHPPIPNSPGVSGGSGNHPSPGYPTALPPQEPLHGLRPAPSVPPLGTRECSSSRFP